MKCGKADLHRGKFGSNRKKGMNSFNGFYADKKVFVTGSTGFKGSWLCLWLTMLNARVSGYSLQPAPWQPLFSNLGLRHSMKQYDGDVTDSTSLKHALEEASPEIVFHLAAQPLVLESYKNPQATLFTNIQGTVNVLEACRSISSVKAIVVVTTDKCYLNTGALARYRESDSLGGKDPYSASKACAEIVTASYRDSFFLAQKIGVATARAGNVIGGGDFSPNRIVPDSIGLLRNNNPITLRNPKAIRPWQHVLEPLRGYLMLGENLFSAPEAFSSAWNFGPSDDGLRTVQNLAEKICRYWGSGSVVCAQNTSAPHEEKILALDTTKSRISLGWQPYLSFDSAVKETVQWYRDSGKTADIRKFTMDQINRVTQL